MKRTLLITGLLLATGIALRAADAKENWTKHCAKCHGEDGKGQTRMGKQAGAKDYTDAKVQEGIKDDEATKVIKEGLTQDGKKKMDTYKDKLSDDEIKALIAHIRSFKK
jgi:mono/diheme cytochrome c family protein